MTPAKPPHATPWALYVGLTLAVCGLFAPDTGLWHDDVQNLFRVFAAPARGEGPLPAITLPTRRLLGLPFLAALASGHPFETLQVLCGLAWLLTGVTVERLARRLWPEATLAGPFAGVLTLTATADFFTGALVSVAYLLSILAFLLALLASLAFLQSGARLVLLAAPLCLAASLWTTDVALPVWALAPLVWACVPGVAPRRTRALACVWYLAALPYLYVLLGQAQAGGGYLKQALVPLGAAQWLERFATLALYNFEPWRWAFERPLLFPRLGEVVPLAARLLLCGAAGVLASASLARRAQVPGVRRAGEHEPGHGWRARQKGVLVALVLMAGANALFVSVQLSERFCRTHLLSRAFASLALGGLLDLVWAGLRPQALAARLGRGAMLGGFAAWVALGVAGGLERQDYLAGYWRAHRQELGSILAQVPGLAGDAHLLLHVPPHDRYLATEAGYLARAWLSLLYQDPGVECRVFLWSEVRPTSCRPDPSGYVCRGERSPDCVRQDGREDELLAFERLVVLDYDTSRQAYVLRRALSSELAGAASYRPQLAIRADAPRSELARALIDRPRGLAERFWP